MDESKYPSPGLNNLPKETENLIEEAEVALKKQNELNTNKEDFTQKEFFEIKKGAKEVDEMIKQKTSETEKKIEDQESEIKKLNDKNILLDRNKIQSDILDNQNLLLEDYRQSNENLKLKISELEKKIENISNYNGRIKANNNELKDTINRFIEHNKNLQNNIETLKKEKLNSLHIKSQILELTDQIKFYQDDNTRLSSEILNIQNKYDTIKSNFDTADKEKNDIFKQIQDLNSSLIKNNTVGTPFVKKEIKEDSINSKVLNDISKSNLDKTKINSEANDLDKEINDIFK
tara:strand:- start:650 stop:1519 length:870 start_codon:yes stop_codon:yes gene_type:complete